MDCQEGSLMRHPQLRKWLQRPVTWPPFPAITGMGYMQPATRLPHGSESKRGNACQLGDGRSRSRGCRPAASRRHATGTGSLTIPKRCVQPMRVMEVLILAGNPGITPGMADSLAACLRNEELGDYLIRYRRATAQCHLAASIVVS